MIIFAILIFNSFYKLNESPPTWTDEGLIIQTAQNLSGQGKYGFQISPDEIISPSFISTSYPVTFPIAVSFSLLGESLLHARMIMAVYIILLIIAVYLLIKDKSKEEVLFALALLSTFPPLYGHGKNVLGEIPGLFFVLLSAVFLMRIEENKDKISNWMFLGLFIGLAVSTKPVFILLLPALGLVVLKMHFKHRTVNLKNFSILSVAFLLPVFLWLNIQFFQSDSWLSVLRYYSNPHSVDIVSAVIANLSDFIVHTRTLFTGGIFLLWTFSIFYRYRNNHHVKLHEYFLYFFATLVFILYFRNPPFYRYFLLTEVLSLVFLFQSIRIFCAKSWQINLSRVFLLSLIVFQIYGMNFDSWVANSLQSNKTKTMTEVIGQLDPSEAVFIYQAPEAVIFLKHFNYYQYFSGTVTTEFGQKNLGLIGARGDLIILTKKDLFQGGKDLFKDYKVSKEFDRYVVARKML